MKKQTSKHFTLSTLLILLLSTAFFAGDNDWRPISPEEIAQKAPKVEADADAEAFFWEVRINDAGEDLYLNHYVRVKIFTERGREKFSKVDIPFRKGMKIKDIAARVIKADGTIVELKKEDVFEREIVKSNDVKIKAKSFAVPNIDIGVIVEYRYKEVLASSWANNMEFVFQRDIPIQYSAYYFKPYDGLSSNYMSFNMKGEKFEKEKGYYRMALSNVPALKEEPFMPPANEVRSWGFVYYTSINSKNYSDFWSKIGYDLVQIYDVKDTLKPGGDSKKLISEIVALTDTDDEKLRKIFDYTKAKIKNITYDTTITDEERDKIKANSSPEQTLKKGQGTANEINDVFATLAVAAGFEARITFTGDRSEIFFSRTYSHQSFVHRACIAIKTLQGWKFFDPGYPFVSFGTLAWFEEDQDTILLGAKDYAISKIPLTGIEKNVAKRTGNFKLLEDGTLEGDVKIEYFGQTAYRQRVNTYEDSAAKREENIKESIKAKVSTAEVSNIAIENLMDADKPLINSYKIKIPNYAQKTGKRLFLQPGFFEYGVKPLFTSATRSYDVYFNYPWSEKDSIKIELPKGYILDNADAPQPMADSQRIGFLDINIKTNPAQDYLSYERNFHFANGKLLFPTALYPAVKNMFDLFHKADSHTITLKQK